MDQGGTRKAKLNVVGETVGTEDPPPSATDSLLKWSPTTFRVGVLVLRTVNVQVLLYFFCLFEFFFCVYRL